MTFSGKPSRTSKPGHIIFNFLGSNYPKGFSWRFLVSAKSAPAAAELRQLLGKRYGGEAFLYYRGRAALSEAVRLCAAECVLVNGFTCYVVEQAVRAAGARPVFADSARNAYDFSVEQLREAHRRQPEINAVIVQNTFGIGGEIKPIADYCRRHKITLIEDLAHCPDNRYADGPAFGKTGDFVVLSFGETKQIDVVSGGALIVRDQATAGRVDEPQLIKGRLWFRFAERLQPLLTGMLRQSYRRPHLAWFFHGLLLKSRLLLRASDDGLFQGVGLATHRAGLILEQWRALPEDKKRRRRLMDIYAQTLKAVSIPPGKQALLRYPVLLSSAAVRGPLLRELATRGFRLRDHWYDSLVYPGRFAGRSAYEPGSCPSKEELAGRVVNLPLHRNVSEEQARELAKLIASYKHAGGRDWRPAERKVDWQAFLTAEPDFADNCLQSFNYGEAHRLAGGLAFRRILWEGGRPLAGYTALLETGRFQRFLTIAGGPSLNWYNEDIVRSFREDVAAIARKNGCIFVRIRPQAPDSEELRQILRKMRFLPAPAPLSVESAGILDISLTEEEIRRKFNKSLRHKVRDALADEQIKIEVSDKLEDAVLFGEIHQDHARRLRYGAFSQKKLVSHFKAFAADGEVLLYYARRQNKVLAANMVFFFGREASHLFGVSTPAGQKYPSAPLLHLEAMAEARRRKLKTYNFWGIVGKDETKHRYYGLSQFKRGFGIEAYQYVPAHDLVVRRLAYVPLRIYLSWQRKRRRL